jgi:hypothetical protein
MAARARTGAAARPTTCTKSVDEHQLNIAQWLLSRHVKEKLCTAYLAVGVAACVGERAHGGGVGDAGG